MAAMIAAMDDGIGHILDTLEERGLTENTIVFFSSDNGPSTESRNWLNGEEIDYQGGSTGGLRGHKGSLFDGGIRVPAIVSWPAGLPQGVEWAEPAAMMDIVPTMLDAVGLPAAGELDGVSVLSAWQAQDATPERTLFWEYGPQLAARRGPWKLTTSAREYLGGPFEIGSVVLVNLDEDPAESVDVSAQHPEIAAALGAELTAWAASFNWDPAPWLP